MTRRTSGHVTLSDDERKRATASIKRFFSEELDCDIGDLKAALVLEYVLAEHGPAIYNKAIADARAYFEERTADLDALSYPIEFPYWTTKRR